MDKNMRAAYGQCVFYKGYMPEGGDKKYVEQRIKDYLGFNDIDAMRRLAIKLKELYEPKKTKRADDNKLVGSGENQSNK